jgi:hypothetical protein
MTILELIVKYEADVRRSSAEYKHWLNNNNVKNKIVERSYFTVNYSFYGVELQRSLKEEFNLSDKQAGYIYGEAYERYHSCFGDVFWGAHALAEFVVNYAKL